MARPVTKRPHPAPPRACHHDPKCLGAIAVLSQATLSLPAVPTWGMSAWRTSRRFLVLSPKGPAAKAEDWVGPSGLEALGVRKSRARLGKCVGLCGGSSGGALGPCGRLGGCCGRGADGLVGLTVGLVGLAGGRVGAVQSGRSSCEAGASSSCAASCVSGTHLVAQACHCLTVWQQLIGYAAVCRTMLLCMAWHKQPPR